MKKILKGFTLAETMIVVMVLGIIATLTIPALVNKQRESVAKTKVRKAMAAYESALNKMIIENDLKDNKPLTDWAGNAENNCTNSTNYFKKVQGDGCIFKTSDGIWWNISNIERPLIAFKQDDLTTEKANAANDYSAFVLVGRFGNDGSLRVDDLGYETGHDYEGSLAQVQKLYNFIYNKIAGAQERCDLNCKITKYRYTPCTHEEEEEEESKSCIEYGEEGISIYDENGRSILYADRCLSDLDNCDDIEKYERDDNGNLTTQYWGCNGNGDNCTESSKYAYDENGHEIACYHCDGNGDNCSSLDKTIYNENGNYTARYFNCDLDGDNCTDSNRYTYNESGNQTAWYSGCDGSGDNCTYCSGFKSCVKGADGYYHPDSSS